MLFLKTKKNQIQTEKFIACIINKLNPPQNESQLRSLNLKSYGKVKLDKKIYLLIVQN